MLFAEKSIHSMDLGKSEELKFQISEYHYHLENIHLALKEAFYHLQKSHHHASLIEGLINTSIQESINV